MSLPNKVELKILKIISKTEEGVSISFIHRRYFNRKGRPYIYRMVELLIAKKYIIPKQNLKPYYLILNPDKKEVILNFIKYAEMM